MLSRFRSPGLSLILLVAAAGCGGETLTPGTLSEAERNEQAATDRAARRGTMVSSLPEEQPHEAVLAVTSLLAALQSGRLEEAYDFLPAKYQAGVDQLLQTAAGQCDPELWAAIVRVSGKSWRLIQEQQPLIQELLPAELRAPWNEASERWTQATAMLPLEDFANLDYWRNVESRSVLKTIANPWLHELFGKEESSPLAALKAIRVTQGTSADGRVILLIQSSEQSDPDFVEFVMVDGRWLPRKVVAAWEVTLEAWQKRLTFQDRPAVDAVLRELVQIEALLDRLLATQTAEDFQSELAPLLVKLWQWTTRWQQPPGPPDGVSITVRAALSDEQQSALLLQLEQLSDDPERCVYTATSTSDSMLITLRPVSDVERFAARLPFAAELMIDAAARTVTFRYQAP